MCHPWQWRLWESWHIPLPRCDSGGEGAEGRGGRGEHRCVMLPSSFPSHPAPVCLPYRDPCRRPPPPALFRAENEIEISLAIRPGGNVVQVYGFCFDAPDGKPRIVMELCAHGSLRAHLQSLPRNQVHTGGGPHWQFCITCAFDRSRGGLRASVCCRLDSGEV